MVTVCKASLLLEAFGEGPSCLFQLLAPRVVLDSWLHPSCPCLPPRWPPPWVCLCVSPTHTHLSSDSPG